MDNIIRQVELLLGNLVFVVVIGVIIIAIRQSRRRSLGRKRVQSLKAVRSDKLRTRQVAAQVLEAAEKRRQQEGHDSTADSVHGL